LTWSHANAAGRAIGRAARGVAVPADRDPQPGRGLRTGTPDFQARGAWLRAGGSATGAIEAPGVFWLPIYELLAHHGIPP